MTQKKQWHLLYILYYFKRQDIKVYVFPMNDTRYVRVEYVYH